jgi:metallo-beta-lactamase family protein
MAISATQIFKRHPECYDRETAELFRAGHDPFNFPGLHFTRETAESMAINRVASGAVILAGAGMCTGGRVRHHLKHNLGRRQSSVIIVGFAAVGTLARRIVDGARTVSIFGDDYPVLAEVHTIGGFSAHAGQSELLDWHRQTGRPETTFLVHGEPESMATLAGLLTHTRVEMPVAGASYPL